MAGFVSYLRVSTAQQGRSGLGLEAQRAAVARHAASAGAVIVAEFVEVESGKRGDRPQLAAALAACRARRATLLIAKLDRLSRDAHFLLGLEKAGVEFIAADMPNANRLTVRLMAVIAQEEREMISARTKAALAAAKSRGVRLGNPNLQPGTREQALAAGRVAAAVKRDRADTLAADLAPVLADIRAGGATSLAAIAGELTARGIPTPSGRGGWHAATVQRVLARA